MVNNPRTTCKINTTEKWNFRIVEDNKKKEMIAADKSNSLYITNKIKKQAYQFAGLHSDKPVQT